MRTIALFCSMIIVLCGTCVPAEEGIDDPSKYFSKDYSPFQGRDFQEFEAAVPESSRFDTLARILEKSGNSQEEQRIQLQIFAYLHVRNLNNWKDHPQLHALIMERSRGDIRIRMMVFHLICVAFTGETKRALVMSFLGDPLDSIRGDAITQINEFDEGYKVLESYIRQHEKKEQYTTSVKRAKGWLERRERKKQKQIQKTPTTL